MAMKDNFLAHRKHTASPWKTNRLILFRETSTAFCENRMIHKIIMCQKYAESPVPKRMVHLLVTVL
jgi:hypothetical protein